MMMRKPLDIDLDIDTWREIRKMAETKAQLNRQLPLEEIHILEIANEERKLIIEMIEEFMKNKK